jgi:diacylglycerol kinase (ATP)
MSEFTCILNPSAGRGAAGKILTRLQQLLREHKVGHELVLTSRPGEATDIARQAPGPFVVAVGGDGTVNEVANGLIGSDKSLGVIPAGSGNDFVKMIGVTTKLQSSLDHLLRRKTKRIDAGTVECGPPHGESNQDGTKRYFVNGVGIGFDAAVAAKTREIKYLRGTLLYIVAVLQMLGKYKSPNFRISTDSGETTTRNLLIAIGNGTCAGGGFYLTPRAKIDDGVFDFCTIKEIGIGRILQLMPLAMRGKHLSAKEVIYLTSKQISVSGDSDFYVHADGEIVGRDVRSVKVGMVKSALSVIVA